MVGHNIVDERLVKRQPEVPPCIDHPSIAQFEANTSDESVPDLADRAPNCGLGSLGCHSWNEVITLYILGVESLGPKGVPMCYQSPTQFHDEGFVLADKVLDSQAATSFMSFDSIPCNQVHFWLFSC